MTVGERGAGARRSPQGSERQRDAERSKQQILDAARTEFAEKGFAGARVREIAVRAGVNQQLISYYFGGKDGLFREITRRWRRTEQALSSGEHTIAQTAAGYVHASAAEPELTRLMAWEGLDDRGPDTDLDLAERTERFAHLIADLRRRQAAGELADDLDPAAVALALIAAAAAPVTIPQIVRSLCGTEATAPEFVGSYAEQLSRLVHHLRPR